MYMDKLPIAIVIIIALGYSLYFFYKAAGTLNLERTNIVILVGGMFFIQTFLGIALIVLGFDKHYTLDRLMDRESSIMTTFYVVMATAVLFPAAIYLFMRLFKAEPKVHYNNFLQKKTECADSRLLFWLVMGASVLCIGLLVAFLQKAGYIPLVKMFFHDELFDMGLERVRLGKLYVLNQYVTNIMIHTAIPVMAYFAFSCAIASKSPKWWALAVILLIAAVIVKTYNFAKAPIVTFLLGYLFILIYHNGKIKLKWIVGFGVGGIAILAMAYFVLGTSLDFTDIYNGLWGRLLCTQVGTLSYNFDLFPQYVPFLQGRSFGRLLLPLFGFDPDAQIRSGRLVMEIYGSSGVYEGAAGVMNSVFFGEAYANFGWAGVLVSIVWVAFVIAAIFALCIKMRKTPAIIAMFAYFTVYIANTTQGGFVDFVYNIAWIVVFCALMVCHYLFVRKPKGKPGASVI